MTDWMGIGDGALHRLNGYEGNIDGAASALSGLDATKPELMKAIAYLALQANTYRHISNQDATLALSQIRTAVNAYYERRPE